MAVVDIYARRVQRLQNVGQADALLYDQIPQFLRKQLGQIFTCCIGPGYRPGLYDMTSPPNANLQWDRVAQMLDRELPSFQYAEYVGGRRTTSHDCCLSYLNTSADLDGALSVCPVSIRVI